MISKSFSIFLFLIGANFAQLFNFDNRFVQQDGIYWKTELNQLEVAGNVRDMDAMDFVSEMGVGWNLGNSLDTKDSHKTYWGNPLPSQSIIDAVHSMGFRTLRYPII